MRISPIPKPLLIHTALYHRYQGKDDWNNTTQYDEPVEVMFVRVEKNSDFSQQTNSEDVTYKAEMLFDMTHSRPKGIEFVEESKVEFNGKTLFVSEVEPVYTNKLHHIVVRFT